MSNNPNNTRELAMDLTTASENSKRAALAGQWRTPPVQVYPAGYAHQLPVVTTAPQQPAPAVTEPQQHTTTSTLPNPAALPDNSEDYAKALQEAYRKGAEAAARMAQHASCPNFQTGVIAPPAPPPQPTMGLSVEEAAYAHHVQPPQSPQPIQHIQHIHHAPPSTITADPLNNASMPPPPPAVPMPVISHATSSVTVVAPPGVPQQQQHQQQQQPHVLSHHSAAAAAGAHPTFAYATAVVPPPTKTTAPSTTTTAAARSMSMPDMSAYAAQAEEEKRQKRLARNRASARLRRLRKKNLVDAYETEVGILEKTLQQLHAHEWGQNDDHKALLDALGMERGQQAIKPEQRTEIIRDILRQQMEQVSLLRQSQLEQQMLAQLVNGGGDEELSKELGELLQLTDEQKQTLKSSSQGLEREIEALETVCASLQAMLENEWLLNEGVQNISDQFTSILHKNQLSKFLLWTDANMESIDQLDHVAVQPLQAAPVFSFGVESTPGDEEEAKAY